MSRTLERDQMVAAYQPQETECMLADHPAGCAESEPDFWLMGILRQAMEELMAAELPPLQRANAIARLGSLFLRAARASELQRANKALQARVAELEKRLALHESTRSGATAEPGCPPADSAGARPIPAEASSDEAAAAPSPQSPLAPAADQRPIISHGERVPGAAAVPAAGAPAFTFAGPRGSP